MVVQTGKKDGLLWQISGVNRAPVVSETLQKHGDSGYISAAPITHTLSRAMHGESAQGWHGKRGMSKLLS